MLATSIPLGMNAAELLESLWENNQSLKCMPTASEISVCQGGIQNSDVVTIPSAQKST